ncbi:MAG TPA: hypothetical protein VJM33_19125 [Microthrixaceae bacterium]|nr:hypothetical protein [Microthrixaceae bacterium]
MGGAVFGGSETAVALLTSPPGPQGENVIDNTDIAAGREIVDRYAGSGRVMTHTIVHPNLGPSELDAMTRWSDELRPDGWKMCTLWDPPERRGRGWFLDDAEHVVYHSGYDPDPTGEEVEHSRDPHAGSAAS